MALDESETLPLLHFKAELFRDWGFAAARARAEALMEALPGSSFGKKTQARASLSRKDQENMIARSPVEPRVPDGHLQSLTLTGCKSLIALNSELDRADRLKIIGADDVPFYDSEDRMWDKLAWRRCEGCGQQCDVDAPRLRVCGGCRSAAYCGVECQRAHWERHRPRCSLHRKERRRLCVLCGRMAADSDPPFPTCYCGERRYCGEACQVRDWFDGTARSRPHSETCASGYLYLEG